MKEKLSNIFKEYLESVNLSKKIVAEIIKTKDSKFGDFTSNIALKISKSLSKKPIDIAEEIKIFLEKSNIKFIEKITVTIPGFINLFLTKDLLVEEAMKYVDENYKPNFNLIKKLKINYEYVSANPTGDLHIGHARNAIVGEMTVRVLKYVGHEVYTEYYINDGGKQIIVLAESVYFYFAKLKGIKCSLKKEKVGYHGKEIISLAELLYNQNFQEKGTTQNEKILSIASECTSYFLKEIENLLLKIGLPKFDKWTSEKQLLEEEVPAILKSLKKNGYTYEKDGATWISTEKFGDKKDRVLIKSDGTYTYMVADVSNHINKSERGFDLMIDLWGKDHHGYEERIQASLRALDVSAKLEIDYISMVQIKNNNEVVKMSKRAGTSLRIKDILEDMDNDVFKYFIVSKSKEQEMEIDINMANKDSNTNPFYYTQYANARINQIIENYKFTKGTIKNKESFSLIGIKEKERSLLVKMVEFEDTIILVSREREPSIMLNYLRELSQNLNGYYSVCRVVSDNNELSRERVLLMVALRNQYRIIFNLMGIKPIDKI